MPDWVSAFGVPSNTPYVVSSQEGAAGVLFSDALQAGKPSSGQQNKILWIAQPQLQKGFVVTAHPLGSSAPLVQVFRAAPGEAGQYPSYDDVPTPGCWYFVLSSTDNNESVDLNYSG
jgi:hypothetical protein